MQDRNKARILIICCSCFIVFATLIGEVKPSDFPVGNILGVVMDYKRLVETFRLMRRGQFLFFLFKTSDKPLMVSLAVFYLGSK